MYAVSEFVGYLKGKSAMAIALQFNVLAKNFNSECFCARGDAVSTVGFEEAKISDYIRNQRKQEHNQ